MTDPKSANDPSMDDILASIRKIISDDEARAQVNSQQAAAQSGRPAVSPPRVGAEGRDDVLLLTDLIEEPRSDTQPPPEQEGADEEDGGVLELNEPLAPPVDLGPPLLDEVVAGHSREALEQLSTIAATVTPAPQVNPLEDMVREMLKPMLREWLDANLPELVERIVSREIERITRR